MVSTDAFGHMFESFFEKFVQILKSVRFISIGKKDFSRINQRLKGKSYVYERDLSSL